MDAKGEVKALEDAERHASEFRAKHKIPVEEWELAEQMTDDIRWQLVEDFWKAWEEGNAKDLCSICM